MRYNWTMAAKEERMTTGKLEIKVETASIATTKGYLFPWGIFSQDGRCLSTHKSYDAALRRFRDMNYKEAL